MLSFELSVIDVVLAISIVIILLLYTTRKPIKYITEPELSREKKKSVEESKRDIVMSETSKRKKSHTRSSEGPVLCPHHLGYLKTLPKRSSIPEECYSCPRMMQCLYSGK